MRNQQGMSLIEMLAALFITSFIGMMMCEIAVTQNVVGLKTNNNLDALIGARRVVPQFLRDVHNAAKVSIAKTDEVDLVVPEFSSNGMPVVPATYQTISYKVVPTLTSGSFQIERQFSAESGSPITSGIVLTNLVGPLPVGTTSGAIAPQVFRYFQNNQSSLSDPGTNPDPAVVPMIVGVRLTCEVVGSISSRADISAKTFAFSTDGFVRYNFR